MPEYPYVLDDVELRGAVLRQVRGGTGEVSAADYATIQAAIDACPSGGGVVRIPPGQPPENVELRDGVYLVGANWGRGYLPADIGVTELVGAVEGPVVHAQDCRNVGVIGLNIRGLGATTPSQGIVFENVVKGIVGYCFLSEFTDEAVLIDADSGGCLIEVVQVTDALLDRTRAALAGAIDIDGTDHWVRSVEATASVIGAVTDANLYCAGFVWRAVNGELSGVIGEISDIGVYDLGQLSTWTGCRADLNRGHGFVSEGVSNHYLGFRAVNNGQDATNTYDNIWLKSTSASNEVFARATSSTANRVRYGVNDEVASATNKNDLYVRSTGAATADYAGATSNGSAWFFPQGAQKTLTVDSATPSVAGYTNFITANVNATTITNFTGGVAGQIITVFCNDLLTTIDHNGSTITLLNAGDKKLRRLAHYQFMFSGTGWREIESFPLGVTADVGNAAKTLTARQSEETQVWNTALTADRAVTLSTTGAYAGATFRVVRTAAATGAFNLNVGTGPLKALTAGTWCDVTYNGTAWVLVAAGSL